MVQRVSRCIVGALVHAGVSCERTTVVRSATMLSEAVCKCTKSDKGTRVAAINFVVLVGGLNRIRLS
jgi:hypothetical protein